MIINGKKQQRINLQMIKDRARDPRRVPSLGISEPLSHVKVVQPTEPWSPKGASTWGGDGKVSDDFREEDYDMKKFSGELSTPESRAADIAKHEAERPK
jgi:hypothetical protein